MSGGDDETLNLCDMGLTEVPLDVIQQRGARVTTLNVSENAFQCVRHVVVIGGARESPRARHHSTLPHHVDTCCARPSSRTSHAPPPARLPTRPPGNVQLLPALRTLILDKNGLRSLAGFARCEGVTTLWLNNNALDDLPELCDALAASFPRVTYLSLMRNPASPPLICASEEDSAAAARYRLYVVHRLPRLEFLDAAPVTPAERADAKAKGQYMAVRKPKPAQGAAAASASGSVFGSFGGDGAATGGGAAAEQQQQQPPERRKASSYLALGTSRYDGRHSEGNRFIQDTHL